MLKEISNLQFGDFTLDRHARVLRRLETILPVTGKAFDLLTYMVENPGRPLSKSELLEAVWPETSVEESNLSQNVFLLRRVLGSGGEGPIKTLPGRGYQFVAQVSEMQTTSASGSYTLPTPGAPSLTLQASQTRMVMNVKVEEDTYVAWKPILIVLATAALMLGGGLFIQRHLTGKVESAAAATTVSAGGTARQTVAVLGFRNISNRPEDSWLSTAVAEMLANEMSSGDKLRVIPNDEVARAQSDLGMKTSMLDSESTRASLRRATGADMLVEGSYVVVTPEAGQGQVTGTSPALRLMVQVQDAHSGKSMASFSETGQVGGLFTLVDQAGTELRKDLSDNGGSDGKQAQAGMSQNSEAMRFYAEGVDQSRHFDYHSARSLFERAVVADPNFAMAHLGLADAWADLGFMEHASSEAAAAFKLSTGLPRESRLAIEAEYRQLSNDDEHAIGIYKALSTFYPDDETWGLKLGAEQHDNGQQKDAVETLEHLRSLPLTPAETVELDGIEADAYSHIDDPGANAKARTLADEAVSIADKQGGLLMHGQAYRAKCYTLSHIGPVPAGRAACEQAKSTFQAVGNLNAVASAINNLGVLSEQTGDWTQAEAEYEECRRLQHQMGNFSAEVDTTQNLAHLSLAHGELQKAIQESSQLSHMTGTSDDFHTAYEGHHYAALALLLSGRLQQARTEAMEAQHAAEKEHAWDFKIYQQARSRDVRGWIAVAAGDVDEAQALFSEALAMVKPTHDPVGEAIFAADQASVIHEDARPSQTAIDGLRNAADVLAKFQSESDEYIEAELSLAKLDLKAGGIADASRAMAEAKKLDAKGDSLDTHLDVLLSDAEVQTALGHTNDARKDLQDELNTAQTKGYVYLALEGEIDLAKLTQKATPSPENSLRLKSLGQQAEHAGFKGLARQTISPRA